MTWIKITEKAIYLMDEGTVADQISLVAKDGEFRASDIAPLKRWMNSSIGAPGTLVIDIDPRDIEPKPALAAKPVASGRIALAEFAQAEANRRLSWTHPTCEAEKYLAPFREPMRKRGQIGTEIVRFDWCGAFVAYCVRKAGYALPDAPPEHWATFALVDAWRDWAVKNGMWIQSAPQTGDIVVFDWDDRGAMDHIGIVLANKSATEILTAEGNKKNTSGVFTRQKNLVAGYIRLPAARPADV